MNFLADVLAKLGSFAAGIGTQGCWSLFFDETEMPKCLLDK